MAQTKAKSQPVLPINRVPQSLEGAVKLFREREAVIFFSYCRFWERHGFVQQSLARLLAGAGVQVVWMDGTGWRPYRPVVRPSHPLLKVKQLFTLPGMRFAVVRRWNEALRKKQIKKLTELYPRAVIWVQAGIDEALTQALPYVDIYSTFDDPYYADPHSLLCQKARLILCQNTFTFSRLSSSCGEKIKLALPPVEIPPVVLEHKKVKASKSEGIKKTRKKAGYIGSFFSKDFNLPLFEYFVRAFPEWDFLLMGRTDKEGKRWVRRLSAYPNFRYRRWAPREKLGKIWRELDLTLLLYHLEKTQDGAFPVKVLESFAFGIPCVATAVPKTQDLEGFIPRSSFPEKLVQLAKKEIRRSPLDIQKLYLHFRRHMLPENQIIRVAQSLAESF